MKKIILLSAVFAFSSLALAQENKEDSIREGMVIKFTKPLNAETIPNTTLTVHPGDVTHNMFQFHSLGPVRLTKDYDGDHRVLSSCMIKDEESILSTPNQDEWFATKVKPVIHGVEISLKNSDGKTVNLNCSSSGLVKLFSKDRKGFSLNSLKDHLAGFAKVGDAPSKEGRNVASRNRDVTKTSDLLISRDRIKNQGVVY